MRAVLHSVPHGFLHDAFDVVIVQPMGKGIIEVGVNQTYQLLILLHDDASATYGILFSLSSISSG